LGDPKPNSRIAPIAGRTIVRMIEKRAEKTGIGRMMDWGSLMLLSVQDSAARG
jgi:hypothetical protein